MCSRAIPGSGKRKLLVWTISDPFKKGSPGFVSAATPPGGEPQFTQDIWFAMTFEKREDLNRSLQSWRTLTNKQLYSHEAIASLTVPQ